MMMTSIPGYSLPALPASNYNYGARPTTTANPEYGSAWKTAVTTPISNSASQHNNTYSNVDNKLNQYDGRSLAQTYAPTSNSASQHNNTYSNVDNKLNQYDGRSLAQTYAPTSNSASQHNNTYSNVDNKLNQYDGRSLAQTYAPTSNSASQHNNTYSNVDNKLNQYDGRSYAYNPTANSASQYNNTYSNVDNKLNQYDGRSYAYNPTANSASQYNNAYSNVDNKLNQYDGRSYAYNPTANTSIDNSRYAYNPTYSPTSNTAVQDTTYNNDINQKLQQYLNQTLTNNTANVDVAVDNRQLSQAQYTQNTANIDNNLLAYYNPITNTYNFPPVPPNYPPVPPNYPPEKPPEKKGSFPWLPVGLGVAGLAAFLIFGNKKHKPPTETPPTETHPKTPKTPKTPDTPEPHVPETPEPETPHKLNRYHIYGDPYITVNGGSVIEHKAGIKKLGGTATVPLGKTDAGTNVSATYVRSLVDGKHGSMESIKKLKIDFPDGKAIAIDTGKAGTFAYIGDEKISLEKNGKYQSGNQTICIENGRLTITSEDSSEVFTVKLGKYTSPKNQKDLGKYFLELDAKVGDFVNGVFDESEVKSTGSRINSEPSRNNRTSETFVASNAGDSEDV
ncbi:MAG: hypothetical protein H2174_09480 [Vampirovibrio sp.]|nr:hypothetical protein [Vampirovibrio sp.]